MSAVLVALKTDNLPQNNRTFSLLLPFPGVFVPKLSLTLLLVPSGLPELVFPGVVDDIFNPSSSHPERLLRQGTDKTYIRSCTLQDNVSELVQAVNKASGVD